MASVDEIVSQMRQALAITEPTLDTSVGTTLRKILDAVGEVIAEAYVDQYLIDYQYDIDAKSGADLDDFIKLFGFARLAARRATGTVTFARTTAAPASIYIPAGTEIATADEPPTIFATTVPAILSKGETQTDAPVQAVVGGTVGNLSPGALTIRVTAIEGITSVNNAAATIGGTDPESDATLRARFKATVFRALAGTEQMFLGIALEDPDVSRANVLGAVKRRREQIEVVAGAATSTVQDAKFIYAGSSIIGSDIDAGQILVPGVAYSFSTAIPPVVTVLNSGLMPNGIYDLEFDYAPIASRNDPANKITNRVDVIVSGTRATQAVESTIWRSASLFNTTANDPLHRDNFRRADGVTKPLSGNYFTPLAFTPVLDPAVANTIVINGVTYTQEIDFYVVNDWTAFGGTSSSLGGIEWKSAANGQGKAIPANLTAFGVTYTFNAIPGDVQRAIGAWRLVTTDVKVHQAKVIRLNFFLAVILTPGFTVATVQAEIEDVISDLLSGITFHGTVQVSDVLEAAHRVSGVDAVRFLHSGDDGTNFAIRDAVAGTTYATTGNTPNRVTDVFLGDDEIPALNQVTIRVKAPNSYGAA